MQNELQTLYVRMIAGYYRSRI